MQLLLTNDDGIEAPGLAALQQAARPLGRCSVLAPDRHLSGCSHQATTHRVLELTRLNDGRHQLDGTPTDCTRVGLVHLCPDAEWVISGINDGGNLGADVYHSGTVAAVREAALLGKPGIAVSQYRRQGVAIDWERAARWAAAVLEELVRRPLLARGFWNVNLPHGEGGEELPEIVFCPLDPNPLPVIFREQDGVLHYHGNYHERIRQVGSDVDVCFTGRVAVTAIHLA